MSHADTPAENTGGNGPVEETSGDTVALLTDQPGALPERIRVHVLAKQLGSSSRAVLSALTELGETVRSPHSSIPRDTALRVADRLNTSGQQKPAGNTWPAEDDAAAANGDTDRSGDDSGQAGAAAATPQLTARSPMFLPPEPTRQPARADTSQSAPSSETENETAADNADGEDDGGRRRRRRGRRGRGRGRGVDEDKDTGSEPTAASEQGSTASAREQGKPGKSDKSGKAGSDEPTTSTRAPKGDKETKTSGRTAEAAANSAEASPEASTEASSEASAGASRRRRRRRRKVPAESGGTDSASTQDDPPNTVVHVRDSKAEEEADGQDEVRSVRGSTRLEAKRQRRKDGREAGRRRAPILSESEFLARRESVERSMVVAEKAEATQIGVLEDGILVEHFVTSADSGSIVGNVYLGRVQNVLPSMEAAFIDIGRGRNAVLYAGEVDWDAAGLEGKARKIEQALTSGDSVLVQVTKDPVGHKGARLTTQISLPGRFLVYVPAGGATGISRKLPENERRRLKDILKRIVPEDAGVIIRTASEGVSEEELAGDVRRLQAHWDVIKDKAEQGSAAKSKKSGAPAMLYEEPDLLIKVVRDLFTGDFTELEVQGQTAWETIHAYLQHVAPELTDRLKRYTGTGDVFADHRIDEQITKALDRKVWLPSGGYLVIDRTEAMTVIDVNTGKFTGSGGNLEETVTRNNLESAEEIVRQLRLRDIGGIVVIDFIDMVLESNRELVLRRLTECLGRDRTRHQVAEVTSLGLVQMTRKRVGTGLLEAFASTCEHCKGRGMLVSSDPHHAEGDAAGTHHHGPRRGKPRGKGANGSAGEPKAARHEPTQQQRESVASAVHAMAQASKLAPSKPDSGKAGPEEASGDDQAGVAASEPVGEQIGGDDQARTGPAPEAGAAVVPNESTDEQRPTAATDPAAEEGAVPAPASHSTQRRSRRAASRPAGPPVSAEPG